MSTTETVITILVLLIVLYFVGYYFIKFFNNYYISGNLKVKSPNGNFANVVVGNKYQVLNSSLGAGYNYAEFGRMGSNSLVFSAIPVTQDTSPYVFSGVITDAKHNGFVLSNSSGGMEHKLTVMKLSDGNISVVQNTASGDNIFSAVLYSK